MNWRYGVLSVSVAALLWVVFVATTSLHELLVGAVCVAATAWFLFVVSRSSGLQLEFRARDVAQGWRILWYIASDLFQLSLVLLKDLTGVRAAENLFRVCGFDSSKRDPVRMARDVLAILYNTTSPNLIVVGIDISQSRMLFHQLTRSEVPRMTKALGAKG